MGKADWTHGESPIVQALMALRSHLTPVQMKQYRPPLNFQEQTTSQFLGQWSTSFQGNMSMEDEV